MKWAYRLFNRMPTETRWAWHTHGTRRLAAGPNSPRSRGRDFSSRSQAPAWDRTPRSSASAGARLQTKTEAELRGSVFPSGAWEQGIKAEIDAFEEACRRGADAHLGPKLQLGTAYREAPLRPDFIGLGIETELRGSVFPSGAWEQGKERAQYSPRSRGRDFSAAALRGSRNRRQVVGLGRGGVLRCSGDSWATRSCWPSQTHGSLIVTPHHARPRFAGTMMVDP